MNKLRPLSSLIALVVGTAFAADQVVPSRSASVDSGVSGLETASRSAGRTTSRNVSASRNTTNGTRAANVPTGNVVSRNTASSRNTGVVKARAATDENTTVRHTGVAARSVVADYGRRAITTNSQSESVANTSIRTITNRAATKNVTKESIAEAKETLEQTAELNKSCQEQYNECMDQFCAVIDANQKRCSCSSNLAKYRKVEDAVNQANTRLNEVAQNIRYIGLSADEIRAIMTATEAEEALSGTTDTTDNRSLLEQIEDMIKDPKTYTASTYTNGDFGLDIDLDFSSESDMFSLDFLNTASTTSFSNLRGAELYKAARNRCNTVLNQCKKAGATSQQVTGNYDLAIDKDCIAYENGLKKMNETLLSNVRSAERMLQKARLSVLQNKNMYDAKGCISALETCMTDDMVCGDDYAKCIDPTKQYIDENGNVVLGQNINTIKGFMSDYNSANVDSNFLSGAYDVTINGDRCGTDGKCIAKYLLKKIGTKQKVTDEGLCRAVLDKCQAYTYTDETYQPYNDIVVNYIQRAMVNIKAAQYRIISDYASSCMVDVASCYNQQVTQVNAWSSSASTSSIYNVMNGACRNVALTCAYGVFADNSEACPSNDPDTCIASLSNMFYQSLLCPDNSTYDPMGPDDSVAENGESGYINELCSCNLGYVKWGNYCVAECGTHTMRDTSTGLCRDCDANATYDSETKQCVCNAGYTGTGFKCTANSTTTSTTQPDCGGNGTWNATNNQCVCNSGYRAENQTCVINEPETPTGPEHSVADEACSGYVDTGGDTCAGEGLCVAEGYRCVEGYYPSADGVCSGIVCGSE